MQFDAKKVIEKLQKNKYPLFVSEADLQLRFAMTAKTLYPRLLFYPEYPMHNPENGKIDHLDLVIFDETNKEYNIVEFKYILKKGEISLPGNLNHKLRDHSAVDIRRYLCYSDISRLEKIELKNNIFKKTTSYFIALSNEQNMWKKDTTDWEENRVDKEFSMHDGYVVQIGDHKWRSGCLSGENRKPIQILFSHKIKWLDYKDDFKFLLIKIIKK